MGCDFGHCWSSTSTHIIPGTPCDCGGVTWEGNEREQLAAAEATIARLSQEKADLSIYYENAREYGRDMFSQLQAAEASLRAVTKERDAAIQALRDNGGTQLKTGLDKSIAMTLRSMNATREALIQRAQSAEASLRDLQEGIRELHSYLKHAPDCGLLDCSCGTDAALAAGLTTYPRFDIVCPKHDIQQCTCGLQRVLSHLARLGSPSSSSAGRGEQTEEKETQTRMDMMGDSTDSRTAPTD